MSVLLRRCFPLVLGLLAMLLILLSTSSHGIGISPDSVTYIAVARNLSAGDGFTSFDDKPVVLWPPLFPIVLALVRLFVGIDPQEGARLLNASLFGLTVLFSSRWLEKNTRLELALLGGAITLIAPPLIHVSTMAWTEPLFILLVILFLIVLQSYLTTNRRHHLITLAVVAALASLTRYIGYTLIIMGVISLMASQRSPIKRRLADTVFFLSCSILPIGVWLARNFLVSDTLFGPRRPSPYSYYENIVSGFDSAFAWVFPERLWQYRIELLGLGIVLLTAAAVFSWGPARAGLNVKKQSRNTLSVPALFIAVYIISLVVSSTTVQQKIDSRYLSPIFVPMLFCVLFVIDRFLRTITAQHWERVARMSVVGGVFLWLAIIPFHDSVLFIEKQMTHGAGYSSTKYRESNTIKWIADLLQKEPDAILYSNRSDALYILADAASQSVPSKHSYSVHELTRIRGEWSEVSPGYLVWFDDSRPYLFTPEELNDIAELDLFADLADGKIYTVSRVE